MAFARDSSTPTDIRVCNEKKPPTDAAARGIDINKHMQQLQGRGTVPLQFGTFLFLHFGGRELMNLGTGEDLQMKTEVSETNIDYT